MPHVILNAYLYIIALNNSLCFHFLGKVNPKVRNPIGDELPCEVKEVDDNVYACSWTPEEAGPHEVDVNFGGQPVKGSPFKANAVEGPDTSPINTDDLANQLAEEPVVDLPVESFLDCSELEPGKGWYIIRCMFFNAEHFVGE